MKNIIFIISSFVLLFSACGKEEQKFEAFNSEAFAYDIGGSWEVNATTRVKGFEQKENDSLHIASLVFSVDLLTPGGKEMHSVYEDSMQISKDEVITDLPLEAQFVLDSTYSIGKYKVRFNVKDGFSGRTAASEADFNLSD